MGIQDSPGPLAHYEIPVFLQLWILFVSVQILIGLQIADKAVSAVQYDADTVFAVAWRTDDFSFDSN